MNPEFARNLSRKKSVNDVERERHLKRTLEVSDLIFLGIGAIIGTGIFVLTGVAAAKFAGPAVTISLVISGVAAALTALVYAELASMIPVSGSAYTYSYAALGELVAWIIGWDLILEYTVAASAVAVGWSSYTTDLLRSIGISLPAILTLPPAHGGIINLPSMGIIMLITVLVILGTKQAASFNKLIVILKLSVIALFILLGISKVNPSNWIPFMPYGWSGVMRGAAIIFFAYIGFDAVSTAAEEVRRPKRDLPLGIIGSLAISTMLYLLVAAILTGMLPYRSLNTASPLAKALLAFGIRWGSAAISVGAIAGLSSVLLVNIFGQSRIFFSMSRDGLLPPAFSALHPRLGTPVFVTILTGVSAALISGLLPIAIVAELANIGTLAAFVLVSIGVIVLRFTRPELDRPFKVPFMPVIPLLAIAFSIYLMVSLPALTWMRFLVWMGTGLAIYFLYGQYHSQAAMRPAEAT